MLKRTKQAIDLWIIRAVARAKLAALTGETLGDVMRSAIARRLSSETPLARQLTGFVQSLRSGQVSAIVDLLDTQQKLAFMEIANTAAKIVEPHGSPRRESPRSATAREQRRG